jgi:arylsulfatase A-like enzyme
VQKQNVASKNADPSRPNVILIVMDTVRADHLSVYGYERDTTPNLKKFSKKATVYTNAIAPSDMTLSTHASIFTGLYASKHRAHLAPPTNDLGRPLANRFDTLAEILSEKGFSTMAVVANHAYVSEFFGLAQGFQHYDQRSPVTLLGKPHSFFIAEGIKDIAAYFSSPHHYQRAYRNAEDINSEVFYCLNNSSKQSQPFFLFINYMDAHWPYIPPAPFDELYPGKDLNFQTPHYTALSEEVMRLERKVTDKEYKHMVSQYDGAIAYVDHNMGELFKKLKEVGFYENSLIIITSDHGEAFGERNLVGHIVSVYQDQVHVPLLVKYPNASKKVIINDTVNIIDLMPTVLEVVGYPIPQDIDGASLLKPNGRKQRYVMAESFPGGWLFNLHPRFKRVERAIFSGTFKFINSTNGKRELYDFSVDPKERINLYESGHELVLELERRFSQWLGEEPKERPKSSSVKVDSGTLERLKSLGYAK